MDAASDEERNSAKASVVSVQNGPYRSGGLRCVEMYVRASVGMSVV